MAVMAVGKMRMFVVQRRMRMRVRVRLFAGPGKVVVVLVMRVVHMRVVVAHSHVFMRVMVVFREVQPDADRHQYPRNH